MVSGKDGQVIHKGLSKYTVRQRFAHCRGFGEICYESSVPVFFDVTSLLLTQPYDCRSVGEGIIDMVKYIMCVHEDLTAYSQQTKT